MNYRVGEILVERDSNDRYRIETIYDNDYHILMADRPGLHYARLVSKSVLDYQFIRLPVRQFQDDLEKLLHED